MRLVTAREKNFMSKPILALVLPTFFQLATRFSLTLFLGYHQFGDIFCERTFSPILVTEDLSLGE